MAAMNDKRSSLPARRPNAPCRRCGRFKGEIYIDLCRDCVEQMLQKHLPRLRRILEDRYGQQLDEWLANGRLRTVRWAVSPDFTVSGRIFRRFLKQLMREAGENEGIWLSLCGCMWMPTQFNQLVNAIYERCESSLRPLIAQQLMEAIRQSPTSQAGQELKALASRQVTARSVEVLDKAVETLADTAASGLANGARVLIELRYKIKKDFFLYTEVTEGRIDPVWKEIADSLPKAVAQLIAEDNL